MIRKPKLDAKRLTTGVLVAGVVAAGAIALAGPAAAAGPVSTLKITPATANAATATCTLYTIDELAADGTAATTGTGVPTVTLSGGNAPTKGSNAGCSDNAVTTVSASEYTISVKDTNATATPVTTTIRAALGSASATATLKVANQINDFVANLAVTPTAATANASATVPFQVTATDTGGAPVVGASVVYQVSGGAAAQPCTNANNNNTTTGTSGKIECDVPAGTTSSTVTFYVNNTNSTSTGRDSTEPQAQATITVTATPAATALNLTCTNQGATGTGNDHACVVPLGTASETLTATVTNTAGGVTSPVAGRQVNFNVTSANGTVTPLTGVTDANGKVTSTLTPTTTTAGETDAVTATSGALTDNDTVQFARPAATTLTLNPGTEDKTPKSTITETGTVTDQFGTPVAGQTLTIQVTTGPNAGQVTTAVSGATGQITLSYTDSTAVVGNTDNIRFSDSSAGAPAAVTAAVNYVASTTPTAVALNFDTGETATTATCATTDTTARTAMSGATPQEVCVKVTNANGTQALQGQSVTFTVSQGTVAGTSPNAAATGASKTYTTTTNGNGAAVAYVYSATSGTQTISATAGGVASNTLTRTITAAPATQIVLTPTTTTIAAGGQQKFTATVEDANGNGVAGQSVVFTVQGVGNISGTSSATVTTGADGTAAANVSVPTGTATGTMGSITATVNTGTTMAPVNKSATSTYSVAPKPSNKVTTKLYQQSAVKGQVMQNVLLSPALASTKVNFFMVQSNGTMKYAGHATTDASGKATHKIYHLKPGTTYRAVAKAVGLPSGTVGVVSAVNTQKVK